MRMRMVGLDVVGADDQTPSGKLSTWDIIKKETPGVVKEGQQIYDDTQKKPGDKKPGDVKPGDKPGTVAPGGGFFNAAIVGSFKVWHAFVAVAVAGVGGLAWWKLRK